MQVKVAKDEFKICTTRPNKDRVIKLSKRDVMKYNVVQQYSNSKFLLGSEQALKHYILYKNYISIINVLRNGSDVNG